MGRLGISGNNPSAFVEFDKTPPKSNSPGFPAVNGRICVEKLLHMRAFSLQRGAGDFKHESTTDCSVPGGILPSWKTFRARARACPSQQLGHQGLGSSLWPSTHCDGLTRLDSNPQDHSSILLILARPSFIADLSKGASKRVRDVLVILPSADYGCQDLAATSGHTFPQLGQNVFAVDGEPDFNSVTGGHFDVLRQGCRSNLEAPRLITATVSCLSSASKGQVR